MSYFDELDGMQRMFRQQWDALESVRKEFDAVTVAKKHAGALNSIQRQIEEIGALKAQPDELDAIKRAVGEVNVTKLNDYIINNIQGNADAIGTVTRGVEALNHGALHPVLNQIGAIDALKIRTDELDTIKRAVDEVNSARLSVDIINNIQGKADAISAVKWKVEAFNHEYQAQKAAISAGMAHYLESPSYNILRSLEEQILLAKENWDLQSGVLAQLVQGMKDSLQSSGWVQTLADVTKSIAVQYDLACNFGVDSLAKKIQLDTAWLQSVKLAASPALSMFANELLTSVEEGSLTPALAEGFGARVLGRIAGAETTDTDEERADALQELLAWFLEQIKRLPRTAISAEGMFNIFILLISLFDNHWLSAGTDRHMDKAISGLEQRVDKKLKEIEDTQKKIFNELEEIKARKNPRVTYVVMESAQLREGPGKEFRSIRVLPPNLLVEEIEREEEWVHVSFFDYPQGQEAQGWISVTLLAEKLVDGRVEQ